MNEELMNETNSEEIEDDFDLFEEETEETQAGEVIETEETENTETANAENTEETAEQEDTGNTSGEEMFPEELVVYGEKKRVSMTDAKALIQKGLAFDRTKENMEYKLSKLQNDPRLSFVDELAKVAGVDTATFMAEAKMRSKYSDLIKEFGSLDEVPKNVRDMYEENMRVQKAELDKQLSQQQEEAKNAEMQEEFYSFMEEHPEVDKIPEDVIKLVADGHRLEGAYAIYINKELLTENESLKKENSVLKQNEKNKKTKTPTSKSTAEVVDDDFWDM